MKRIRRAGSPAWSGLFEWRAPSKRFGLSDSQYSVALALQNRIALIERRLMELQAVVETQRSEALIGQINALLRQRKDATKHLKSIFEHSSDSAIQLKQFLALRGRTLGVKGTKRSVVTFKKQLVGRRSTNFLRKFGAIKGRNTVGENRDLVDMPDPDVPFPDGPPIRRGPKPPTKVRLRK
jgi:hypothetical protein